MYTRHLSTALVAALAARCLGAPAPVLALDSLPLEVSNGKTQVFVGGKPIDLSVAFLPLYKPDNSTVSMSVIPSSLFDPSTSASAHKLGQVDDLDTHFSDGFYMNASAVAYDDTFMLPGASFDDVPFLSTNEGKEGFLDLSQTSALFANASFTQLGFTVDANKDGLVVLGEASPSGVFHHFSQDNAGYVVNLQLERNKTRSAPFVASIEPMRNLTYLPESVFRELSFRRDADDILAECDTTEELILYFDHQKIVIPPSSYVNRNKMTTQGNLCYTMLSLTENGTFRLGTSVLQHVFGTIDFHKKGIWIEPKST